MFVMFFVKFKMFTIVGYFLIPMLILQTLTICLFTFQIGKTRNYCSWTKLLVCEKSFVRYRIPLRSVSYPATNLLHHSWVHETWRKVPIIVLPQQRSNSWLDHFNTRALHAVLLSVGAVSEIALINGWEVCLNWKWACKQGSIDGKADVNTDWTRFWLIQ